MSYQPFLVGGLFTVGVKGYALGAYHPCWIRKDGAKIKNPAFDDYSQHVLNLKFPNSHYFGSSVKFCAGKLLDFLKSGQVNFNSAEFLIIPSSKKGNTSVALERIVTAICRADRRLSYRPGALSRTKDIAKLATGGDRSIGVHLGSMAYKPDNKSPSVKILLDDVMTSGNSLEGAITVIQQHAENVTFVPIVFGRTTHD